MSRAAARCARSPRWHRPPSRSTGLPRPRAARRRDLAWRRRPAVEPAAKLATARMPDPATACHSLANVGAGDVAPRRSMPRSTGWAASSRLSSHAGPPPPAGRALLLYDVSPYLEGRCCRTGAAWRQSRSPQRPAADCHRSMCAAEGLGHVEVFKAHHRSGDAGGTMAEQRSSCAR